MVMKLGSWKKGLEAVMEPTRSSVVETVEQRLIGGGGDVEEVARRARRDLPVVDR